MGYATPVIHVGPDPLFQRLPMRGYRAALTIAADPAATVEGLSACIQTAPEALKARRTDLARRAAKRAEARQVQIDAARASDPMGAEWPSHCLSEAMDEDAVVFSELGLVPGAMRLKGPNRLFSNPIQAVLAGRCPLRWVLNSCALES